MDLPAALRQALGRVLDGVNPAELTQASATLSARYRAEVADGTLHLSDDRAALAYLAARLPATYGAVSACLTHLAWARPDFLPETLFDVGAGPGTVLWAALTRWPGLQGARLLEASTPIRRYGERLAAELPLAPVWLQADVNAGLPDEAPADLVTLAYVLDELGPDVRTRLVTQLWALTGSVLLIVEPGTPAGWQRILAAREQLIGAGAHILAPCPHAAPCPLHDPDWCHFSQRVPRSRTHRQTKGAVMAWEDEKYSFVVASRQPGTLPRARVLSTPRGRQGLVSLKLCRDAGDSAVTTLSKRDGDTYKRARRLDWGDPF